MNKIIFERYMPGFGILITENGMKIIEGDTSTFIVVEDGKLVGKNIGEIQEWHYTGKCGCCEPLTEEERKNLFIMSRDENGNRIWPELKAPE